jgi:hypothetical protein
MGLPALWTFPHSMIEPGQQLLFVVGSLLNKITCTIFAASPKVQRHWKAELENAKWNN